MFISHYTSTEAWQTIAMMFGGALFGFIAAWLLWIFWWSERKRRLEEKGEHYRDRIQGRFDRLHEKQGDSGNN